MTFKKEEREKQKLRHIRQEADGGLFLPDVINLSMSFGTSTTGSGHSCKVFPGPMERTRAYAVPQAPFLCKAKVLLLVIAFNWLGVNMKYGRGSWTE